MIDGTVDATSKLINSQTSIKQSNSQLKVSRSLTQALKAGNAQARNFETQLSKIMNDYAKTLDIRAVIFGTFYRCGFDLHELSPTEKQAIEVI